MKSKLDEIKKLYSEFPEAEKARFRHELNTEGIYQEVPEYSEDTVETRFDTLTETWELIIEAKKNGDHKQERKFANDFFLYCLTTINLFLLHCGTVWCINTIF